MKILLLLTVLGTVIGHKFLKEKDGRNKEKTLVLCESSHGDLYTYKYSQMANEYCGRKLVKASYHNEINKTGWAYVEVDVLDEELPHYVQGYAAGYIEGKLTRDLIDLHIQNTVDGYCEGAEVYCEELQDYLIRNLKWMIQEINSYPTDDYWIQVNLTLNQLVGMIHGYEGVKPSYDTSIDDLAAFTVNPIYLIQIAGDLEDIENKLKKPDNPKRLKKGHGHCSALVKLLPDYSELYTSHVTWSSYSSMLRMQKKYTFKTGDPGRSYSFSGYPGAIVSIDDFVVTSAKLAVFETTIGNYNKELFDFMGPKSVLCWIRSQIAHRTSSSGLQWAEAFAKHNSGTYNNQWVIVDYKKFRRGRPHMHEHGLVHVLEQLPKHIVHSDVTKQVLNTTYWPSYNSPSFKQIFRWSGSPEMVEKYGDWYTYDRTPRALIFARDHSSVKDLDSMIKLMRSNNYKTDPLSRCNCTPPYSAENAISCRSELNPENGTYPFGSLGFRDHGATDMKVTDSRLIEKLQFSAIAGPTHDPTPVFDWETAPFKGKVPHAGQPNRWTFAPVVHKWGGRHFIHNDEDF